ncbi:LysR family transcriptional regulator [Inquilinus limosus]|uniref:LysR family transcriptional regulator n=1 Tax=Inquilinus limosus TaxID=171674 RepID=UPI003F16B056
MNEQIDWEDLHTVLAVAEAGSLAGAARRLGVNHTTVLRRIGGFEQRLGLRLFDRLPGGYALTAGGEELVAAARGMAATVEALERRLAGQDLRLEGTLRVATADTLMASVLPSLLAQFRELHPGIVLEVTTANLMANLTRRDADVAIRPVLEPPETLVGRRVAGIAFAVYAAASHPAARAGAVDPAAHAWVTPDDSLAGTAVARWMRQALPAAAVALRTDSLVEMCRAARAGIGLAALPCYLGDTSEGLVRIATPTVPESAALWVLTHEDLRRTARVSAFTEFAAAALTRQRDLLEGRRPAVAE